MKVPSAGTLIKIKDLIEACIYSCDFEGELKQLLGVNYCFTANSGTTAFYIILNALKKLSDKKEVLLPAYTAPSLILPIRKAGLKYRLVDISLNTFNMDLEKTLGSISEDTLAILFVHMFGVPMDIEKTRRIESVFVIEDAASSFGTRKGNRFSSTFGDIGFISFNRGKNLSTVSGGVILTDNEVLAQAIQEEIEKLPFAGSLIKTKIFLKALALSFAVRPWFYTVFRQGISMFKYTSLHEDFDSFHYTAFQRSLGSSLLKRSEEIFSGREAKGMMLYHELKSIKGIRLPAMPEGWNTVFNQFPLIVEDAKRRKSVLEGVIRAGVEATTLYENPINKIYDDFTTSNHEGYPNAEYLAERLVLIPVHHYVAVKSLYKSIGAIKKTLKS
jgi:perosamine synthetase